MSSEIIIAICSLAGTLFGSLAGILGANRLVTYRILQLEHKVERHNQMVERMAVVERDQKTMFRYHDDHRARITKLEEC